MPTYELSLILRTMSKPELVSTLKRIAVCIYDKKGIIRKIENLGHRPMPYKTSAHGLVHREASFFLYKFDTPAKAVSDLIEEFGRDVDIVRKRFYKAEPPEPYKCTLEEELLPPAYRKDVQKLIEIGKTQQNRFTHKFKYNSGFDYYPFQR